MKKLLTIILPTAFFTILLLWMLFGFSFPAMATVDDLSPVSQPPTSTTIILGTSGGDVTVNNFYTNAAGAEDEFVILAQNGNYVIDYDTDNSGFDLDVAQASFDANRLAAETTFLSLLGVSQAAACKLTVAVSEAAASSSLRLPLSFCASSTFSN
jgi:hypothetical protein